MLVLPGDRTAAEAAAVAELVRVLEERGVAVESPSAARYRRRPSAFLGQVVLAPLHTGEDGAPVARALALGSSVVTGPVQVPDGTEAPPCEKADDATLVGTVLRLLGEDASARAHRAEAGRGYHTRVHSPAAVSERLERLLAASFDR